MRDPHLGAHVDYITAFPLLPWTIGCTFVKCLLSLFYIIYTICTNNTKSMCLILQYNIQHPQIPKRRWSCSNKNLISCFCKQIRKCPQFNSFTHDHNLKASYLPGSNSRLISKIYNLHCCVHTHIYILYSIHKPGISLVHSKLMGRLY